MEYQTLRGEIKKHYSTEEEFAKEVLKITGTSLSRKYKNRSFSTQDIEAIKEALGLSVDEIGLYFFKK